MRPFHFALTLCGLTAAQSVTHIDPWTQIVFQSWTNTDNGFKVSLALPETASTDLIAQIQAPLKDGIGWAGIGLGPSMLNYPLIAVWTHDNKILSSVRQASMYSSPPVFKSDIVVKTIAAGTSTNATHLTYTFLCQKCNLSEARLGWAMSSRPVPTPKNVDGSRLGYHKAGSGVFDVDLEKAKNAGFAAWAAAA